MKKEIATLQEMLEHAAKYGRDWATDRAAKHALPVEDRKWYWNLPKNPKGYDKETASASR